MYTRILRHGTRLSLVARNIRNVRPIVPVRTLARSFVMEPVRTLENSINRQDTFLVFPEIINENPAENEFMVVPSNGQIPYNSLTVEKVVKATGKFSMEFEQFLDEYSSTLRKEYADQDVSNGKLTEFITEMEKHLVPLSYNLNLLNSFRIIRPNEFNFTFFNTFFGARYRKARQRFVDRQIYCFMCEMKARREFFDDSNANDPNDKLSFDQKQKNQIVDRYIRESKLLGQSFKHQEQNMNKLITEKLQEFQLQFTANVMKATERFKANVISPQFLDCLPDHVITNLNHHDAESVFQSFMRYCPDQNLRKDFWYSFYGRAAKVMGSKINNALVIESIRDFRNKRAKLLGYDSFADMAVELRAAGGPTMAGSVDNINAFISGLGSRSDERFNEAIKELEDFATARSAPKGSKLVPKNTVEKLNLWDVKYFERLFLRKKYEIDASEVKKYFPINKVVSGMLNFAENLFGLKIVEQKAGEGGVETWGQNCRVFKVFSNNSKSMAELGSFYFDPFQRDSKIMIPVPRCDSMGTKPLAFFLMNFNTGRSIFDQFDKNQQIKSPEKEVLLDFEQIVEMFGRFGFVLQHLLTEVKYSEITSLHNIEADAFWLVSHFMRCWPLNSYEVIRNCSQHVESGEPISEEFFQRMNKAYYHFTSIGLKHNLYMMAMDLNLHATKEPLHVLHRNIWNQFMSPFEENEDDGHMCAALDIFSGNTSESVTYGDKWSEVIAADIFDAFRAESESGMKSPEQIKLLGERFRETFLAQTGAVSTNELFRRFRGRDAVLDGFLSINQLE